MSVNPEYEIGQEHDDLLIDSSQENHDILLHMLSQANRSLYIYSRYLDGKLYDTAEFISALRQLATQHKQSKIRILLKDIEPLVKYGHRIIETARHLSSYVEIRTIHADYSNFNESFFVVDERAIVHRKLADRYEAVASYNKPKQARELINYFQEVWQHSLQAADARRLYI